MATDKIRIEIDGKPFEVEPGKMIIEVADREGINIPRFCYHKKLSIAANCRMCLVEVEKSAKELPACATPVTDGMKVFTHSKRALAAQKAVMEFLLINHPLDCPICDQGGECELQDVSMGYGKDVSRYNEGKRVIADKDIGPLIATDMTRCIHCTRCVRFGDEVAGLRELGATGRGEKMEIGTYIEHSLQSEISGNVIDLCPVGALTSKPFRFTARAWELNQKTSIAAHDCLGSNIYIHTRHNSVMRVVPKENETINETWLSDRDRFSYTGLQHADRVAKPLIKQQGVWQETDWQTAFEVAVTAIRNVLEKHGSKQLAGIASPSATIEEYFLFQKWLRGIECHNIDHRIRQTDTRDQHVAPLFPKINIPLTEIENQDAILILGADIHREQPLLGQRVRKASLRGVPVMLLSNLDHKLNFAPHAKLIAPPHEMLYHVAGIAKALLKLAPESPSKEILALLKDIESSTEETAIAHQLKSANSALVMLGAWANSHPEASTLRALAKFIAHASQSALGEFTPGANSAGAWLAGCLPHREAGGAGDLHEGLSAYESLQASLKAYVLLGVEPEFDCADPATAIQSLKNADFVVCLTPYITDAMREYATVILPTVPFTETSGTFVNVEGQWQSFEACTKPFEEARPAWKVLRVFGNFFELNNFDYQSSEEVRQHLNMLILRAQGLQLEQMYYPAELPQKTISSWHRLTPWGIYATDAIVRRAQPLHLSATRDNPYALMHPLDAQQAGLKEGQRVQLKQGQAQAVMTLSLDEKVPSGCILTYGGFPETASLGNMFGPIEIQAKV